METAFQSQRVGRICNTRRQHVPGDKELVLLDGDSPHTNTVLRMTVDSAVFCQVMERESCDQNDHSHSAACRNGKGSDSYPYIMQLKDGTRLKCWTVILLAAFITSISIVYHFSIYHPSKSELWHVDGRWRGGIKGQGTTRNRTTHSTTCVYTVNSIGRLGNQMGEYATLLALAKTNGCRAHIPQEMHNYLAPYFRITLPVLSFTTVNAPWKEYWLHDWMLDEYRHVEGKFVKFIGYPCSWTFYHHMRKEILKQFSFHDHVKEKARRRLARLRGQHTNATYVGVHVRRGDYVRVMPEVWKGVVADRGYLDKAIDYFRTRYPTAVFVVASDEIEWCRENIDSSRGDVYFVSDEKFSAGDDMALLSQCNHTIMTIGTFGFWAAYLAGGETVHLDNFTLPNSPWLQVFNRTAAFLPGWIGIAANLSSLMTTTGASITRVQVPDGS